MYGKHSVTNDFSIEIDTAAHEVKWTEYDKDGVKVERRTLKAKYHIASPLGLVIKLLVKMMLAQAAIDGEIAYGNEPEKGYAHE